MDLLSGSPYCKLYEFLGVFSKVFPAASLEELREIFKLFDLDADGILNDAEQRRMKDQWLERLTVRKSALVIVDFQNDFISGSLAIEAGPAKQRSEDCIAPLNGLIDSAAADLVVFTLDWHPDDHVSFVDNTHKYTLEPKTPPAHIAPFNTVNFLAPKLAGQTLWPRHCVQNSWGAQIHKDLRQPESAVYIRKGLHTHVDSYSAFCDNDRSHETELDATLRRHSIDTLFVCGLAYDVCVAATAEDALRLGYKTALLDDCCKGLDGAAIDRCRQKLSANGAAIVESGALAEIRSGSRVPWEWARFVLKNAD